MNLFTKEEIEEHEKQLKLANEALDWIEEAVVFSDLRGGDEFEEIVEKHIAFLRGFFQTERKMDS